MKLKESLKSVFYASFCGVMLVCCDSNEDVNLENSTTTYELPNELKIKLKQSDGMLVFEDECQFDEITNMLVYETEKYISEYFSKFSDTLTKEEINDIVEKECFNPNTVYESFESFNGFHSLRAKLKQQEDEWLEKENPDEENPLFYPLSERCLPIANTDGEYQIGMNIYRVEKNGDVYVLDEGDYVTLANIRKGNLNEGIIGCNLRKTRVLATECKAYKRITDTYESNGHKMEMILDLDWDGWGSAAKAKVLSYKKKKKLIGGGSKWGREWTGMGAQVHIQDYNMECEKQGNPQDSGMKSRNWAYYVSVHLYQAGAGFRVKPDRTFWGKYWTDDIENQFLVFE